MPRLTEYLPEYDDKLVELMSQGLMDCEIYAQFGCSANTFRRWRKEFPSFEEAYQRGLPLCESKAIIEPLREMIRTKNERGYRALAHLGRNKFGHDQQHYAQAVQNTQINVQGNLNVLQSKSKDELIEAVQNNLEFLKHNNVMDVEVTLLPSSDARSDKQN